MEDWISVTADEGNKFHSSEFQCKDLQNIHTHPALLLWEITTSLLVFSNNGFLSASFLINMCGASLRFSSAHFFRLLQGEAACAFLLFSSLFIEASRFCVCSLEACCAVDIVYVRTPLFKHLGRPLSYMFWSLIEVCVFVWLARMGCMLLIYIKLDSWQHLSVCAWV